MKRSTKVLLSVGGGLFAAGLMPGSMATADTAPLPTTPGESIGAPTGGFLAAEYATGGDNPSVAVSEATIATQEAPSLVQDPHMRTMAGIIGGTAVLAGTGLAFEYAISRRRMATPVPTPTSNLQEA